MMTLIVYSVGFAGTKKKNNKQIKASPSLYNKANFEIFHMLIICMLFVLQ